MSVDLVTHWLNVMVLKKFPPFTGNYSFAAAADPLLASLIIDATKSVLLNCSSISWCTGNSTVFDLWLKSLPDKTKPSLPK